MEKIGIECVNLYPSNSIIGFKHPNKNYEYLRKYLLEKILLFVGISDIDNSFRLSTMSVLFEKKYNKLIRGLHDSCIRDVVGDLFHVGHLNLFRHFRKFGDYLLVGVHSDESVESYKRMFEFSIKVIDMT